jgi:hypothetical protein
LNCRKSGFSFAARKESDGARGADAADADHLRGHVTQLKPVEEDAPIIRQRLAIASQLAVNAAPEVRVALDVGMKDERRIVIDSRYTVDVVR